MAIYHLSIKIISRGKGKSAVASAAYRAGEKLINEREGTTHDYTRKKGVVFTEILLPDNAPPEYANRSVLWNEVEKIEIARNSQLAREIEIALPVELTAEQNLELVRDYVKKNFVQKGMCADIAIHDTGAGNPHAHIMLTMRPIEPSGKWGSKQRKVYLLDDNGEKIYDPKKRQYKCTKEETTDWNDRANAEDWREKWGETVNAVLEQQNHAERIDHRSNKRQGKEELPTVHLGVAASQMEQKGIPTERGNRNRKINDINKEIRQLRARLNKIDNWIKEEKSKPEEVKPPTLYDVVQNILNRQAQAGKSQHYQSINNIKASAKMLNFITENYITDMSGLQNKVTAMNGKLSDVRGKLKPVERRLKTLDEHIEQGGNYKKYKSVYEKYNSIQPSITDKLFKRDPKTDFYEENRAGIILFETADRYLKEHLNGKTKTPPLKKWKAEREELTAKKELYYREYYSLKNEVKEVEQIKRSITDIVQQQEQENRRTRKHDIEL